jgi:hypothetical protein
MSTELLAMLGGGASGFLFKLIGTLVQNQAAVTEGLIKKQQAMDSKVQMQQQLGWIHSELGHVE